MELESLRRGCWAAGPPCEAGQAMLCYDILRSAVLVYAMLCRALPCIAYPLGIIAVLDIRLCE